MKEYVKTFIAPFGHKWNDLAQESMMMLVRADAEYEGLTVLRTNFHHSDGFQYTTGWAVAICEERK